MRVKLCVRRNGLPDANLVWPVVEEETGNKLTVARLLSQVDEAIPLESVDWALEDYVLEIGGFECLHFQYLSDILKEGDQVTIRPLDTLEVRARKVSGRRQISAAGIHLFDGIPFGTRPIRRPERPTIMIPPRKRRRVSLDENGETVPLQIEGCLSIANVDNDEEQLALLNSGGATLLENSIDTEGRPTKRRKTDIKVHFDQALQSLESPSDSEEDDDFDPESNSDASEISLDDADISSSSSETSSSGLSEDTSDLSSEESSSESDSDSELSSDTSSDSEESIDNGSDDLSNDVSKISQALVLETAGSVALVPYREGKRTTHDRNKRRQDKKRLLHLERVGILPPGSTHEDMRKWMAGHQPRQEHIDEAAAAIGTLNDEIQNGSNSDMQISVTHAAHPGELHNLASIDRASENNVEVAPASDKASKTRDFEKMRERLVSALASGGVVNSPHPEPEAINDPKEPGSRLEEIARNSLLAAAAKDVKHRSNRSRLDVDGSRRLLFGSLGVKTPKTKADEERTKAKLMDIGKLKKPELHLGETLTTGEDEVPADSDAWRSKICLRAVECMDQGIKLSEPPYPFKQRWDPQQQLRKGNRNNWANKRRKRKGRIDYAQDAYDYETNNYLDYGDDSGVNDSTALNDDEEDERFATGGGKSSSADYEDEIESQLLGDIRTAIAEEPDLPDLPADPSALPDSLDAELIPGTIIVYKLLEMSQATNWEPRITPYKTAEIIQLLTEASLAVRLAVRDRVKEDHIKYDPNGNRIYSKFEVEGSSEDEEEQADDGIRKITIPDLIEIKTLRVGFPQDEQRKADDSRLIEERP